MKIFCNHKETWRDFIGSLTSIFISRHILSKNCEASIKRGKHGEKIFTVNKLNVKDEQTIRLLIQVGIFQLANSKEFSFLMLLWGYHDRYNAHCKEPTSSRLFSISSLGGLAFPARPSVPSICSKNYDPFSSVTTSTSYHPPPQPDPVFFLPSRLCGPTAPKPRQMELAAQLEGAGEKEPFAGRCAHRLRQPPA